MLISPVTELRDVVVPKGTVRAHVIYQRGENGDTVYQIDFDALMEVMLEHGAGVLQPAKKKHKGAVFAQKAIPHVSKLWHVDSAGNKNPDHLCDKLFVHLATYTVYRVTGCGYDATADEWCVRYSREFDSASVPFEFTRTMSDFLTPGKFTQLK